MAANYGVQKSTINGVLSWYEKQNETKFAIYRGNKENDSYLSGGYHGSNKDEGFEALQNFLNEIESNDFNIYFLKLLPDNAKSKLSTPGITFQLYNSQNSYTGRQVSGTDHATAQLLHEVLNEVRALRAERLEQMESDDDDDDEQPEQENILAGLVNQPQMQNILIGMLSNLFAKPQPQAIAGIETDLDAMQKNIELLMQKGVTPADIAKLAAMEQSQINFLLSMLRK